MSSVKRFVKIRHFGEILRVFDRFFIMCLVLGIILTNLGNFSLLQAKAKECTNNIPFWSNCLWVHKKPPGPWWWLNGQPARPSTPMIKVWILLKSTVLICQLFVKNENKRKEAGDGSLLKNRKSLYTVHILKREFFSL